MPDLTKLVGFRASWPEFDLRGGGGLFSFKPPPPATIHEGWVIGAVAPSTTLDAIVVLEDGHTKAKSIRMEEATLTPIYRD